MTPIYPHLAEKMKEHNLSYPELANLMGISEICMYRRLRGLTQFQLPEIIWLCKYFKVSDATYLFYS